MIAMIFCRYFHCGCTIALKFGSTDFLASFCNHTVAGITLGQPSGRPGGFETMEAGMRTAAKPVR